MVALGKVINCLADSKRKKGNDFIPYRDSKLTRVLQESLGGNALTVMIATLSPAGSPLFVMRADAVVDINYGESLSTLKYASRAKHIKSVARQNEGEDKALVRDLRREALRLKSLLGSSDKGASPGECC